MGDTLDETIPPARGAETRRDKPQTLSGVEARQTLNTANECTAGVADISRNRARTRTVCSDSIGSIGDTATDVRDERKHSYDGVVTVSATAGSGAANSGAGGATMAYDEFSGNEDKQRRESLNIDDNSPSSHGLGKALFGRSAMRHPSSGGPTTRKCVLTLDGYSYVIVASTPENLPKRDDLPTGTGSSCSSATIAGIAAATSGNTTSAEKRAQTQTTTGNTGSERSKANSPTAVVGGSIGIAGGGGGGGGAAAAAAAGSTTVSGIVVSACNLIEDSSGISGGNYESVTINGQIARHGSLTIVRRSNSRKSFTQLDAQQSSLLASPSSNQPATPASASAATSTFFQQTHTNASPNTTSNTATNTTTVNTLAGAASIATTLYDNRSKDYSNQNHPTSTTAASAAAITATPYTPTRAAYSESCPSNGGNNGHTSTTTTTSSAHHHHHSSHPMSEANATKAMQPSSPNADLSAPLKTGQESEEDMTQHSDTAIDLATENLPAVDTPDACDKAAVRLRCLLHMLTKGEVSAEVLQKNLHYAARVLEAVFIDEARSPSANNTKLGQNTSSSVECEDQPEGGKDQRCNGNCKNLNCSQHSHENHTCDDSASVSTSNTSRSKSPTTKRARHRRSKPKVPRPCYKYDCNLKENHGQAIFGVSFNHWLAKDQPLIFATAGANRCTVYECPRSGGLKLLMCYADPDPDEVFYTCAWTYDVKTSLPLLATAGYRGVIRVIDTQKNETIGNYIGHGQAINELKYHPRQPHLLLSGSKDHAIRLWNMLTHVCIAIFGGVEGHRDEVLSIDFDLRGERIMSSGMDHSLKLWCINTPDFQEKIELSRTFNPNKSQLPFPTIMQHFPDFSTRDIHRNYVDCVQWFGDFVLSKSCENSIVCWKPGQLHQNSTQLKPSDPSCTIIAEFDYAECEIWFVRFGFNPWHKIIALGNQHGKVYVWELDPSDPGHSQACTLNNLKCTSTVRQVAISRDGSVLISVCDDGTVWRWTHRILGV